MLEAPPYRANLKTGIVHFGPGAFHRAHQADFIHRVLEHDPRWGIAAVSLRSSGTIEALQRQDGLYTLAVLDAAPAFRTIGAHSRLFGPGSAAAIAATLADPDVRMVTTTVTEKGYCLAGDGSLDFAHPDIVHDLAAPDTPVSIIGWLTLGLARRRAAGLAPFATLCCDNLASNGRTLARAVAAFARARDPELARWIEGEAIFPNTMVDSITPATTDALREQVRAATGFADEVPVGREAYAAWVIEDVLPAGDLAGAGAILTHDVAAFERAKLRLLNGAHSTLAYLGLLRGHATVAEAMGDAPLAGFVERMMRVEIAATLVPTPIDLDAYTDDLLARFRNPAIAHKLEQIAWDGSQKLPYRLIATLHDARAAGRRADRIVLAIAGWMAFVIARARAGVPIIDPLADRLAAAAGGRDPIERLLDIDAVFPGDIAGDPGMHAALTGNTTSILAGELAGMLERFGTEPMLS